MTPHRWGPLTLAAEPASVLPSEPKLVAPAFAAMRGVRANC